MTDGLFLLAGGLLGFGVARWRHLRALGKGRRNRNAVWCGAPRADGAPCTLEQGHLGCTTGHHSYCGILFQDRNAPSCPLCGCVGGAKAPLG